MVNEFYWSELAFGSKKAVRDLKAQFIVAPRSMSRQRLAELLKTLLPHGPVVLGLATEPYVQKFDGQPQFALLTQADVQPLLAQLAQHNAPVSVLHYSQADLPHILEKKLFKQVILVNGSWPYSFHVTPAYYVLQATHTPHQFVSPFRSEDEAKAYAEQLAKPIAQHTKLPKKSHYTSSELMDIAELVAQRSYDYSYQAGAVYATKTEADSYTLVTAHHNQVVPFETFALHYGASRERHVAQPGDLNHYDTIHAEIAGLLSGKVKPGSSLFINLLPCPTCCRALIYAGISEVVYRLDHSSGYSVALFEKAGVTVRRLVADLSEL